MPIKAYKNWLLDPEYQKLSIKEKREILSNYFDGKMVDEEFHSLQPSEQDEIRREFLKDHFTPDIEKRLGVDLGEPISTRPGDASEQGVLENLAGGFMQGVKAPTASVVGLFDPEVGSEMQRDIQEQHPTEGAAGFIGKSLGGVVPSVAALPAGPAAAALGLAGYYGTSGAGEERIKAAEARKAGQDVPTEQEFKAAIGNALIQGGGEAAMGAAYAKLFGAGGKLAGKLLPRTAKGAGIGSLVEGGEEAIQQTAQNVLERETGIDPDRGTFEDVPESALGGAIGGGFIGGVGGALTPQSKVEGEVQPSAQGKVLPPQSTTGVNLSGMEKVPDAEIQKMDAALRGALVKDPSDANLKKGLMQVESELARREQAQQTPDALRNQANNIRMQLVKEPDETKREGLLNQLTQVEERLQAVAQRTLLGTPLQTPETPAPDTRPSAVNERDALRQEEVRLNQEVTDHHKRAVDLQSRIASTTNDHTKRMILMDNLAAELANYKEKFQQQARVAQRLQEVSAAEARQKLPAPPETSLPSNVNPNLITPTRGSMTESQVEAGMAETPMDRGGVEASTAKARQERTVSQPSAVAPEAVDIATDYGVQVEAEAKISAMPRKELNTLAKSYGMDHKGDIKSLRTKLIVRNRLKPMDLGIDRAAIRARVEAGLNQRQQPPEGGEPTGPAPTKPTTPPAGPAPRGPQSPSTQGVSNDTQNIEGLRGEVQGREAPGGTVQDQGAGGEAAAAGGALQAKEGQVTRKSKPRQSKPGKPLHEMKFSTWLADALYKITGKRGSRIDLPAPNIVGSHEFWSHADILDRYKHNDSNARKQRKGELFISPARIRAFTGLSSSQAKRNGDVDIRRIYDEFRSDFPGFFPNVDSEQNYGTDYEQESIKAFMSILKSKAPTILDAAKENGVTILDESVYADEILEKHQSEEEAEFEAWLDEHPEERKRIEDETAKQSRAERLSNQERLKTDAVAEALEALQKEGYPADAIDRDTVEILVDSGYTTEQILESFARDQEEDVDFNPDEFKDAFGEAVDKFEKDKANPKGNTGTAPQQEPQAKDDSLFEPPDVKGNQQGTFLKDFEDQQPGLFSAQPPVAPETIIQEAKDTLGTTEKLTEAGFVLPDGTLIRVGQQGGRKKWYTDTHQWIASLIPSLSKSKYPLMDFMEAGAIRIDYQPGGESVIEIRGVPTAKQRAAIAKLLERSQGPVTVDMWKTLPDGQQDNFSGRYTDANKIVADAKGFKDGKLKMTGSVLQQFHHSDGTRWTGRSNQIRGMNVTNVAKAIAPLGFDVEVVDSVEDIAEAELRDKAVKFSQDGFLIEGAFSRNGKLYLIASNLPSAKRAVEVALHEAVGHKGLNAALGDRLTPTMQSIADSKQYGERVAELADVLQVGTIEAAEEFVAREVESGKIDKTLWSQVAGAIRNALRKMGIKLDFSNQDLKRLIRMAHKAAQRQGQVGQARFSAQPPAKKSSYETSLDNLMSVGATRAEAEEMLSLMGVQKDAGATASTDTRGFSVPEQTALQKLGQTFWNKFNRLEQVQDIIGEIPEDQDAVMANELLPGRSGNEIIDFGKHVIDPILKRLAHAKLTLDDLGVYLYAKHAQERNEHIERKWADIEKIPKQYREIIDVIRTQGSGMTNEEANAILELYKDDKVIQELAQEVWAYEQKNRDRRLAAGLLTADEHHVLSNMFEHYVPLKRDKTGKSRMRTGKGLSVSGPEIIQAWGRTTPAQNPFVQSTLDTVEAIVRSEKNQAIEALAKLVEANPNDELWTIHAQQYHPYYNEGGEFQGVNQLYRIDENDVEFKRDGKPFIIKIHDDALARAYKNVGADQSRKWVQLLQKYNGLLRKSITTWSVQFGLTNFERDFQTAMVHLAGEIDPKIAKAVAKDIRKSMRGVWRNVRDKNNQDEWSREYDELRKTGGVTGWFDYDNFEQKVKRLENELKQFNESPTKAIPRKLLKPIGQLLEDYNQSIENAVRLATYIHLRKAGWSQNKAAQFAKNVTVNFDKKGLATNTSGVLYLFSNAAIGGAMRNLLSIVKHKGTRKIVAGLTATAFLSTLLNRMVDDDDEYDKISPYNRDMNLLIPVPGLKKHVSIRAAYGYNVFNALGNVMADMLVGREDMAGGFSRVVRAVDQGFNPLGSGSPIQTVMPTIADPWVQIWENKRFHGGPMYKEQPPYQPKVPDSELYFRSARKQTVALTKWLNAVTGGSEKVSGFIDVNPEVIDHLLDSYTGGVGKLMGDTVDTLSTFAKMEIPEARKVPILQVMVKEPSASFARSRALDTLSESGRTIFSEFRTNQFRDDLKYALDNKIITGDQYGKYLKQFVQNQVKAKASLKNTHTQPISRPEKPERPARPERQRPDRPTRRLGLGTRPPITIGSFA